MIKVLVSKEEIKIIGHSDYNLTGEDIVCSSASSIFITTVNAILSFDKKALDYKHYEDLKDDNNDYSLIKIYKHDEITNKLIDNMLDLFQELSQKYPKDIIVKEK